MPIASPPPFNNISVQNSLPPYSNREPPSHPGSRGRPSYKRFPHRPHSGDREGHSRPHPWPSGHKDAVHSKEVDGAGLPNSAEPRGLGLLPQEIPITSAPGKDDHPLKIPNLSLTPATLRQYVV